MRKSKRFADVKTTNFPPKPGSNGRCTEVEGKHPRNILDAKTQCFYLGYGPKIIIFFSYPWNAFGYKPWRADSIRCARNALILPSRLWLHRMSGYEPIVPTTYAEYLEARNASIFVIKKSPERNQIGVPPSHRPKTEAEERKNKPFIFPFFLIQRPPPPLNTMSFPSNFSVLSPVVRPPSPRMIPGVSLTPASFNPPKMGARWPVSGSRESASPEEAPTHF